MIRDELTSHDVFGRHDGGMRQQHVASLLRPVASPAVAGRVPAPGDEPTGDLTAPVRPRGLLRRLDARTRSILTGAAVAAVLVNAGAVWAYWHITDSASGRVDGSVVVELNLSGRSDLNKPLTPGSTGDLTVTLTNSHDFPIRVTSVAPASGPIMADDEHRENGCVHHGVTVAERTVEVRWDVDRNHVAAFTVPDGLTMAASSDPACAGAAYTVPVLVKGTSAVS